MEKEYITENGFFDSLKLMLGKFPVNEEGLIIKNDKLLKCKNKGIEHCIVPEGVTIISDSAFKGLKNLKTVILPSSLKAIGAEAFSKCKNLRDITIPESIEYIGANAFYKCKSLKELTIPDTLETLTIENEAIPTTLDILNYLNSTVELESEMFEDFMKDENHTFEPENPSMKIFTCRDSIGSRIKEFIKVEHWNERYSVNLGENKFGCPQTLAFLKFELFDGCYEFKIQNYESLVFAPFRAKIKLTVLDESGKTLFEMLDFMIDGNENLKNNVKNNSLSYISSEDGKDYLNQTLNHLFENNYIDPHENYDLLSDALVWRIINEDNEENPVKVEILEGSNEKPIIVVAPIRVLDGRVNLGKLNFENFSYSNITKFKESFWKNEKGFLLMNVFSYDDILAFGKLPSKSEKNNKIVEKFELEFVKGKKSFTNIFNQTRHSKVIKTVGQDDALDDSVY